MTEESKPTNPYDSMKDDVIKEHLDQIASVLGGRSIDVDLYKVFGLKKEEAISEEDKKKIEEHSQFSAVLEQVREAVGGNSGESTSVVEKSIDPNVERVAKMSLDSTIKDIKGMDSDFPVDDIIGGSNISVFDKIEIANGVKKAVEYHKKAVDSIRETVNGSGSEGRSQFSSPGTQCNEWTIEMGGLQSTINGMLKEGTS